MYHSKFKYTKKVIESGMSVLLTGEAGSGKSTLAMQIAEEMDLDFYTMSGTKQTSVNAIIGFISINGTYIPSQFRKAFENGGLFLLDEIDAMDPNVLLTLNTIENGFVAFPDGIVKKHEDFRLVATSNPFDAHSIYTGRSKLDFSTIDRYFVIELKRDSKLESSLICEETKNQIELVRSVFKSNGSSLQCTMRDAIRISKLKELDISKCEVKDVIFSPNYIAPLYKEWKSIYEDKYAVIDEPICTDEPIPKSKYWRLEEIVKGYKDE